MAEDSGISWTHNTQNFWLGCDTVAPECSKCYISRILSKQGREPWGKIYRSQTWEDPWEWEAECTVNEYAKRVFTCSLSDFFHVKADPWRKQAWRIIKRTPHLVWLILTKRPERIEAFLPHDWGNGYSNVWLGVSTGCRKTLNKMDTLRRIPAAVRWVSAEPLIEDISADINLEGFGWVVVGGESGSGNEYLWKPATKLGDDLENEDGRRTMRYQWAASLRDKTKAAGLPFMFKQVTAPRSGFGYNALDGKDWHEFPPAPNGYEWAPRQAIPTKCKMTDEQWQQFKGVPTSGMCCKTLLTMIDKCDWFIPNDTEGCRATLACIRIEVNDGLPIMIPQPTLAALRKLLKRYSRVETILDEKKTYFVFDGGVTTFGVVYPNFSFVAAEPADGNSSVSTAAKTSKTKKEASQ